MAGWRSLLSRFTETAAKVFAPVGMVLRPVGRFLRRLLPDSLGGWMFTVVISVVVVVNGAALTWYAVNRDQAAAAAAASEAADQIIAVHRIIERIPEDQRNALIERIDTASLRMGLAPGPIVTQPDRIFTSRIVFRKLRSSFPPGTNILIDSRFDARDTITARSRYGSDGGRDYDEERRFQRRARLEQEAVEREGRFLGDPPPELPAVQERERSLDRAIRDFRGFRPFVRVSVEIAPNLWLNARVVLETDESLAFTTPFIALTLMTIFIALVAVWGVRSATKPLSLFANAAERLGIDFNAEPLSERGPGEVRRAARAFNTMQNRLKRFIRDRTQMLAAISHDLRTPITRLRLRAEFVEEDDQREKMLKDLEEMEAMISATLAFARDDAANEPAAKIDLGTLLTTLAADFRAAGHDVAYDGPERMEIVTRPLALKRGVGNLIDNAVKYGSRARVSMRPQDEEVWIFVDDDGPGIPDDLKERVFTPFFRVEGSRSRETGGTGLGLTIARNAARSMGGDVELMNRAPGAESGGLRVKVTLPLTDKAASSPV